MSEHSPGPWRFILTRGPDNEPLFHEVIADGKTIISTWAEPHEANARLIAAAPDLLESLRWALPLAELALEEHRQRRLQAGHSDIGRDGPVLGLWPEEVEKRDKARAAITKATKGKSNAST